MFDVFNVAVDSLYKATVTVAWFAIPLFLLALSWKLRLYAKRMRFLSGVKWEVLEIRIPKDVIKTPKSMEQVFSSLYGIYSFGMPWMLKYLEGKVDLWISFEMVGKRDGIDFYVRTPSQYKNLVESAIYSQYPEVEITPAADYMDDMPPIIPNDKFDLWGTGLTLAKPSPYPIKTYFFFEDIKEEKRVDPLSTIMEAMSKLKDDETIIIQLLFSPVGAATGNDIKKEGEDEIKKIIEEKSFKRSAGEGAETSSGPVGLTSGYKDVVKAIEEKMSKLAFQVSLRFLYIDNKEKFSPLNIASVMGSFQQFNTHNLNSLRPDRLITVFGGWFAKLFDSYKNSVVLSKKRRLFECVKKRAFGYSNRLENEKLPVLNTEELATLFHFPAIVVKAPKLKPVESRKGEPPVNLPVEG